MLALTKPPQIIPRANGINCALAERPGSITSSGHAAGHPYLPTLELNNHDLRALVTEEVLRASIFAGITWINFHQPGPLQRCRRRGGDEGC